MKGYIGIKLGDEWLELPEDLSIQIEVWNTLFEIDRIPGTLTYPFTLPFSRVNDRLLGFAGHLAVARWRQQSLPAQMFLMGQLWRVGKLNVLKRTDKGYSLNFQTDVGAVSDELKEKSLRQLDLGTVSFSPQVQGIYPESEYALFPVKNAAFYPEKRDSEQEIFTYGGYVNYYRGGFLRFRPDSTDIYPFVPFPYLVPVLRRVLAAFGYTAEGAWLEEEETRRLVIYNTWCLDIANSLEWGTQVEIRNHVPDMQVNEFLKAIRSLFCLGMVFNATRKTVEIVRLRDVAQDRSYVDWTGGMGRLYDWDPSQAAGFLLRQAPDSSDELWDGVESVDYTVGAGAEEISCAVGTLRMYADPFFYDGMPHDRVIPEATQEGGNLDGNGEHGDYSLRLLSYRGMVPDAAGALYPQADAAQLAWPLLYEQYHRPWLEFRQDAELIETEQTFRIADLIGLDPKRRAFIRHARGTFAGLWEKVNVTVSTKKGIQPAKVPLRRIY